MKDGMNVSDSMEFDEDGTVQSREYPNYPGKWRLIGHYKACILEIYLAKVQYLFSLTKDASEAILIKPNRTIPSKIKLVGTYPQ